ncbi:MAG: hypothetical protein QMD85_03555 [Candidatus Aenigmarchaeota archaeon]|nr:hypothetical protein [Candidatus Aenigmarchaeota archaeon]MDI6722628.1 hypothetical protein [Candidatus Aenigmarchaeota archaeon]
MTTHTITLNGRNSEKIGYAIRDFIAPKGISQEGTLVVPYEIHTINGKCYRGCVILKYDGGPHAEPAPYAQVDELKNGIANIEFLSESDPGKVDEIMRPLTE